MAVSIWSFIPRKELTQLVRLGLLARCRASCQNSKLSCLMDEHTAVARHASTGCDQTARQFATRPMVTEQLKLSHCSRASDRKGNASRQAQASRGFHQRIGNSSLGPGVATVTHSRLHFVGLHSGSVIPSAPARLLHLSRGMWAGHNKWSKVKHIKGPKDAQRSLLFNKLILQMRFAVREGGPNPEVNSALASLVSQAKQIEMPKATIEGVLKNAARKGIVADADTQILLEARGPGQSCLLIDVLTDNARRTRIEIQRILQKNGGDFGTALYTFSRKGVVRVQPQIKGQEESLTLDLATEIAIEVGAEDVQETSNEDDAPLFMFICDMADLRTVRNNLASLNYAVESSSFEYLPETTIALNDTNLEDAFRLISLLNDNPQVVKIYDNVESSS